MRRLVRAMAVLIFVGGNAAADQSLPAKVAPSPAKPIVGGQTCGGAPADVAALLKADQDFNDDTVARGLKGFLSFLADDVATLRPDRPVLTGKKALAEAWTPLLTNPALAIRWRPLTSSISAGGDLGYTVGSYEIARSDEQGQRVVSTGKYVTIWRRQADGSWKVAFDSGVPDSPPKP